MGSVGHQKLNHKKLGSTDREEVVLRVEAFTQREVMNQALGRYQAVLAEGLRLVDERVAFRKNVAADTQASRYQDMTFRIFRNDAIQICCPILTGQLIHNFLHVWRKLIPYLLVHGKEDDGG